MFGIIIYVFIFENIAHFKGGISYEVQKILLAGVAALSLTSASLATPKVAHAAGGNVFDGDQRTIVGMWVEVQGGRSGWAKLGGSGYNRTWYYDTQGKPYQVHVGVGGTPLRWGANIKSGWNYNQGRNIQVNTVYSHWFKRNVIDVSPSR